MRDCQLRSFIAAAELGSFSKAARALYITPASFIQQINLLESTVGFKLFVRRTTGVALTDAGERFLTAARSIIDIYDRAVDEGRQCAEEADRVLRIGCAPEEMPPFLPSLCAAFTEDNPRAQVEFVTFPYAGQCDGVAAGLMDIAFLPETFDPLPKDLRFVALYRDPYYACLSPNHRLAHRDSISLDDLEKETLYIEKVYESETSNHEMIKALTSQGRHVAIDTTPFTRSMPMDILMHGGIIPIPLRYLDVAVPPLTAVPLDIPEATYGIVCMRNHRSLVDEFIQLARRMLAG